MQELFSKVSTEKRHLYGANGVLGHRRATSTSVPSKSLNSGHRRTYSNTSSDFKAIFCTNPALLQQIEKSAPQVQSSPRLLAPPPPAAPPLSPSFLNHINKAYDYFILNILPTKLITPREKLKNSIKALTTQINKLQKSQLDLINTKNDLKGKLSQEIELKNSSEAILYKCKKRTNELEIALKKAQEELKAEKNRKIFLIAEAQSGFNKSLSIDTEEIFMFQKVTPKSLYNNSPNFPLTPTSKCLSSSNNPY